MRDQETTRGSIDPAQPVAKDRVNPAALVDVRTRCVIPRPTVSLTNSTHRVSERPVSTGDERDRKPQRPPGSVPRSKHEIAGAKNPRAYGSDLK